MNLRFKSSNSINTTGKLNIKSNQSNEYNLISIFKLNKFTNETIKSIDENNLEFFFKYKSKEK